MATPAVVLPPLSDKEELFVAAYVLEPNTWRAAMAAGYSENTARKDGKGIRERPHVRAEIDRRMMIIGVTSDIGAVRVLRELGRVSFSSVGNYFVDDGSGKPKMRDWSEFTPDELAAISEVTFETVTVEAENERGEVVTIPVTCVKKFKLHAKTPALELLGKHFALWEEKHRDPNDRETVFGRAASAADRIIARSLARAAHGNGSGPGSPGSVLPPDQRPAPNGHGAPVASGPMQGSGSRAE